MNTRKKKSEKKLNKHERKVAMLNKKVADRIELIRQTPQTDRYGRPVVDGSPIGNGDANWRLHYGVGGYSGVHTPMLGIGISRDSFLPAECRINEKNAEIVRLLCYHEDIDVNKRKHGGYTPLMVAVENANFLLVNVLLECSRKTRSQIATALFNNVGLRSPFALKNIIKN